MVTSSLQVELTKAENQFRDEIMMKIGRRDYKMTMDLIRERLTTICRLNVEDEHQILFGEMKLCAAMTAVGISIKIQNIKTMAIIISYIDDIDEYVDDLLLLKAWFYSKSNN
jgi:hypothetical protein